MLRGVTATSDRATYRDVFAVREFRALYATRTLSITAFSLRILAVSVLVLAATDSPLLAGIAFGIGFFPQIVGGMFLMSLADRLRPRRALVIGGLLEAAAAALVAWPAVPAWGVLCILGAAAMVQPVFTAAAAGLVPTLLRGDAYVLGRSVMTVTSAVAQIAGLGLGGVALVLLPARQLLLIVMALQLLAALCAWLMLADRPPRTPEARGTVRTTWQVNAALMRNPVVRGQLLAQALPATLVVGGEASIVAYAHATGEPDWAAGVLLAAPPLGMALGNLAVGRLLAPHTRERLTLALLLLLGAPLTVFVLRPSVWVAVPLLLLCGSGLAYELGIQRRFLEALPEEHVGQAFGLVGTLMMSGQGLGPFLFGAVGSLVSPPFAMTASGVSILVVALLLRRQLVPARIPVAAVAAAP
jgi:MFS family permease